VDLESMLVFTFLFFCIWCLSGVNVFCFILVVLHW
jgi:hypothetical protein